MESLKSLFAKIDACREELQDALACAPWPRRDEIGRFLELERVWSSNVIEGYAYTLEETARLLQSGTTASGKALRDALAVEGLHRAEGLMREFLQEEALDEANVLRAHALLAGSLHNEAVGGAYRSIEVHVSGSRHKLCEPGRIAARMEELFARLNEPDKGEGEHVVVRAARFHKEFVFLHPFADGNGRMARLCMNWILARGGCLPVAIPPVVRARYMSALEKAWTNDADFVRLVAQNELSVQRDVLRMLRE